MDNTKKMTTSAIMAALAVGLSLMIYFLPMFQFAIFIVGIPIVMLGKVTDIKMQLMASAVVILILSLLNPGYAASIALLVLITAVVQGYCFKKNMPNSQIILYGTLGMVFGFLTFVYGLNYFFQIDIVMEMTTMMDRVVEEVKAFYMNANLISEQELVIYFQALDKAKELVLMGFPSIVILSGFIHSVGSYVFSRIIMKRMKMPLRKSHFKDFRIEKNGRFIIMIVLGIVTIAALVDKANTDYYILNFVNVFDKLLHMNGMAFIWFLFDRKRNKTGYKILSVVIYMVSPILGPLDIIRLGLGIIGFTDMYVDFRKRIKTSGRLDENQ